MRSKCKNNSKSIITNEIQKENFINEPQKDIRKKNHNKKCTNKFPEKESNFYRNLLNKRSFVESSMFIDNYEEIY